MGLLKLGSVSLRFTSIAKHYQPLIGALYAMESLVFKDDLPELCSEVHTSLISEGLDKFASQLSTLKIKSCESFASDNSAFTIEFTSVERESIEDSFPTGDKIYTVMLVYSTNEVVIGLDIIGCENTELQKQLLVFCV